MEPEHRPGAWLPLLVLVGLALLALAGWKLFPLFSGYMSRQDCIASGHMNC